MANLNENPQFSNQEGTQETQPSLQETSDLESATPVASAPETPDISKDELLNALLRATSADSESAPANQASDPEIAGDELDLEKILAEDWDAIAGEMTDLEISPVEQEDPAENTPKATSENISGETVVFSAIQPSNEPDNETLPVEESELPARKVRPKRKKGAGLLGIPHILATAIWLALIVVIGVSMGRMLWVCCSDIMAFGKGSNQVTITITKDDNIDTISQKLGQANLIRYPGLFKAFATLTGKDERISVGTFTLNTHLDYNAMINAMTSYGATREVVSVMLPEGATCAQIFKLLEDNNVCTVEELEEYAANGELSSYWFLEGVPRGSKYCLEGYLAPDTYNFYTNDTPRRVLEKFLNEFDDRFTDIMKDNFTAMQKAYTDTMRAKGCSEEYISQNPLTLHQVVTLASIVLKETSSNTEGYTIASVFYNRMTHPEYLILGSDATVYYALGDYFGQLGELSEEQLNVDSPYNTRKNKGFPPGPICNPDVHALYAALEPVETDYYYFIFDPKAGTHLFAVTYQEHLENIKKVEEQ